MLFINPKCTAIAMSSISCTLHGAKPAMIKAIVATCGTIAAHTLLEWAHF